MSTISEPKSFLHSLFSFVIEFLIDLLNSPEKLQQASQNSSMNTQPITQQPITQQPITQQPITQQPITQQPITPIKSIHMELHRKWFTNKSTIGELYVDDVFLCNTLEDVVRPDGVKIYGETAISEGTYKVELAPFRGDKSKIYPHLLDVPMFTGICIHSGNTAIDTLGCILLGVYDSKVPDFVGNSVASLKNLLSKLTGVKKIDITIQNIRSV